MNPEPAARPPWLGFTPSRRDAGLVALLAVLAVVTRWAVRARALTSWDAGNLAAGIEDYDFLSGHPHPPFYPLAIFFGKVLALVLDPVAALVVLSVVATGVMAVGVFAIARAFADPWTSFGAGLLVVLSPLALFNGSVPLSYALEGAASTVVAWAALRCRLHSSKPNAILFGTVSSIAIGIRPSSALFLGPLMFWGARRSQRTVTWATGAGFFVTLAWLVPMLWAGGGGLGRFLLLNRYQSRFFILRDTAFEGGWPTLKQNFLVQLDHLQVESTFLVAVVFLAGTSWWMTRRFAPRSPFGTFLAAWLLPSILFYVLVYDGWPVYANGYAMVYFPGLMLWAAVILRSVGRAVWALKTARPARLVALALVVVVAALPLTWPASWGEAMEPQRASEQWLDAHDGLRDTFPANQTAILTRYEFHWAMRYYPEYLVWVQHYAYDGDGELHTAVMQVEDGAIDRPIYSSYPDGFGDPPHPIPSWVRQVVLFEGHPASFVPGGPLKASTEYNRTVLPGGQEVRVLDVTGVPNIEVLLRGFDDDGKQL